MSIDYEAALAKLAWSQLQGPWELPAELARLAIASGARSVILEVDADRLALSARDARLEHKTLSDFASILDRALEPAERHRALVELEEQDAFGLAAIACSDVRALTLETGLERQGMKLELDIGGELRVAHLGAAVLDRSGVELAINGLEIDAERAERWLSRVGRFARVPILVNGRRINRGFSDALIRGRIAAAAKPATEAVRIPTKSVLLPSLPAALAIPSQGGAPRLWLLRHGIVATRATVPGYPPFEAAIEMAPAAPGSLGAAALRERVGPYLHSLLDGALSLAIRLARQPGARQPGARQPGARQPETLPEGARARAARILLEALRKRRRVAEISGVKIFPVVSASGRRLASIDEIARLVRVEAGGVCALEAIPPGQDPRGFALPERGALVLSENERALLGDHLCVVFNAPPARLRRSRAHRLVASLTRLAPALRLARCRPIAERELTDPERAFLEQLRSALASSIDGAAPEAGLRPGRGPAIHAQGHLTLARSNPEVRLAIRAVNRDPTWLYPALACLLEKRPVAALDLGRSDPRRKWLNAMA